MSSPTARTLKHFRDEGWTVDVVERWLQFCKIRKDFLGCIDMVALHKDRGILGIQATSDSNVNARLVKAKAEPRLRTWLESGGRFCVIGWGKRGPRGGRKLWLPRIVEIDLSTLDSAVSK